MWREWAILLFAVAVAAFAVAALLLAVRMFRAKRDNDGSGVWMAECDRLSEEVYRQREVIDAVNVTNLRLAAEVRRLRDQSAAAARTEAAAEMRERSAKALESIDATIRRDSDSSLYPEVLMHAARAIRALPLTSPADADRTP